MDLLTLIHLHINCLKEENLAKFTDTDSIVGFTGLCLKSKISMFWNTIIILLDLYSLINNSFDV